MVGSPHTKINPNGYTNLSLQKINFNEKKEKEISEKNKHEKPPARNRTPPKNKSVFLNLSKYQMNPLYKRNMLKFIYITKKGLDFINLQDNDLQKI